MTGVAPRAARTGAHRDRDVQGGPWRAAVLALVVVAVLRLVQVVRHEPWRDELQAWALATDTDSLGDMIAALRHEGHPPLWYLVLRGVSLVRDEPGALHAVAWLLAVGTAALVLLRAPWPLWFRLAVTGGYYLGFEYGVVARSYSLQAFLVLLACVALTARRPRPWAVAACLAGLALTSVFGVALALALALAVLVPGLRSARARPPGSWVVAGVVAATVIVGGYALVRPVPGALPVTGRPGLRDLGARVAEVGDAFVPLPDRLPVTWDTSLLDRLPFGGFLGLLVLGVVAVAVALTLRRDRVALAVWCAGLALTVFAVAGTGATAYRHTGAAHLLLLATLWLHGRPDRPTEIAPRLPTPVPVVVTALMAVSVAAGLTVAAADLRRPFSTATALAEALGGEVHAGTRLVGDTDYGTAGIATLLGHEIAFATDGRSGTYVVWARERDCADRDSDPACVPLPALLATADAAAAGATGPVVVVTTYPVEHPRLRPGPAVHGGMAPGEQRHHTYRLVPG